MPLATGDSGSPAPSNGGSGSKTNKRAPKPGTRPAPERPTPPNIRRPSPPPAQQRGSGNRTTSSSTGRVVSGTGGGGGGGGIAAAPPAPSPMSINDWLGQDSAYISQKGALAKALADYQAQMGKQQTQYEGGYKNNLRDLGINKTRSMDDQQNDFASRGLLFSGVYGQDASKLVNDFSRRESDLALNRSNWLDNLATDFSNFKDQQQLTEEKAKQDAIARRAAQYGL